MVSSLAGTISDARPQGHGVPVDDGGLDVVDAPESAAQRHKADHVDVDDSDADYYSEIPLAPLALVSTKVTTTFRSVDTCVARTLVHKGKHFRVVPTGSDRAVPIAAPVKLKCVLCQCWSRCWYPTLGTFSWRAASDRQRVVIFKFLDAVRISALGPG